MTGNRWWHALFATTIVVLGVFAVTNLVGGLVSEFRSLAALLVVVVAYVTIGRRAFGEARLAYPFVAILIVAAGVATSGDTTMAFIQCIAMPLVWILIEPTRHAIIGTALLTVSVAVGMAVFLPPGAETLVTVLLIQGVTFVGSLALGLWITRIAELSEERARLLDELRLAQAQVEALGRDAGTTSERERLAREIHDTIAQSLTGLVMLSQRAQRELTSSSRSLGDTLALLEETARDTLVETRSLVAATAPVELEAGIGSALARLGRRFERETGIAVSVDVADDVPLGDPLAARDAEVVLLRCAQEGLANVRKHSGARAATLSLRRSRGDTVLTIADDGCGFDPAAASDDGFGLAGLRDRIALVHGRLDVVSAPGGGGASVVVALPVPA